MALRTPSGPEGSSGSNIPCVLWDYPVSCLDIVGLLFFSLDSNYNIGDIHPMEFQVSARKWRPQKFSELIGQEHIVRTLTNAIELGKTSHAYLFSGTRGVGKTTTARIFAKALNCDKGPNPEPCDTCDFCKEIRLGSCIDVREIDGASNNSVAEARELIETTQYVASASRYKVYIIDEVHMLSKSAFNALLKTLEEPPPRVVFLFATTELSKIPETILSRCQCFEFKPLSHKQIIKQLELICSQEEIEFDKLSLEEIAKAGAGSMRDAQSLLDQVIAYCGKNLESASVEEVLGIVGRQSLVEFINHLIKKDSASLITSIQEIIAGGKDLNFFCRDLTEYLRNLMMVKLSDKPETLLDTQVCDLGSLKSQAEAFHIDDLQQMFTVLIRTEFEMKRSSLAQMILEMAVLRLVDVRPFQHIDDMIKKINLIGEATGPMVSSTTPSDLNKYPTKTARAAKSLSILRSNPGLHWDQLKQEICRRKPIFNYYFSQCKVTVFDESNLNLSFVDVITLDQVKEPENLQLIKDLAKSICKLEVDVQLNLGEKPIASSSNLGDKKKIYHKVRQKTEAEIIQEALDVFGGVVIK